MQTKIAINGLGRIGRCVVRAAYCQNRNNVKIVAINSSGSVEQSAHYIKYDSTYGILRDAPITFNSKDDTLQCGNDNIAVLKQNDPEAVEWSRYGTDIVLECTGKFTDYDQAAKHLRPQMQKVIVSAPAKNAEATIVYGVNHHTIKPDHRIISGASCTTNCLAPVAQVIAENLGLVSGHMTTIHSYTNDQCLLDSVHTDLRRSRAAAVSMIPASTGAAKSIGLVLPELNGKIDGASIRVPTAAVSMIDFVFAAEKSINVATLNELFIFASQSKLQGILAVCDEPLVSIDFVGNTASAVVDLSATKALGRNLYRVAAWYDNEFAFATRMLDIATFWGSINK